MGNGNPSVEGAELPLKFPARKVRKKSNKETSCISYALLLSSRCVQNSVHIARILGATLGAAREGKMAPDFP
jgi:hypothetical protein